MRTFNAVKRPGTVAASCTLCAATRLPESSSGAATARHTTGAVRTLIAVLPAGFALLAHAAKSGATIAIAIKRTSMLRRAFCADARHREQVRHQAVSGEGRLEQIRA